MVDNILYSGALGAANALGTGLVQEFIGNHKKRKLNPEDANLRGSLKEFALDQHENTTTGTSNCQIQIKKNSKLLTFNQNGRWNPNPPDYRTFIYRAILPRLSLCWSSTDTNADTHKWSESNRHITQYLNLTNTQINDMEDMFGNTYKTASIDSMNPSIPNVVSSTGTIQHGTNNDHKLDPWKIKQWQHKLIFKNITTYGATVTIYDYVCIRDSHHAPKQLLKDWRASIDSINKVANDFASNVQRLDEIALAREPRFDFDRATNDLRTDTSEFVPISGGAHHVGLYWKLLKRTHVRVEPGGIFEYVQSMYNIRVVPKLLTDQLANGASYQKGISRCLLVSFEGEFVSAPETGDDRSILKSDGHFVVERFQNATFQNHFYTHKPYALGLGSTKGNAANDENMWKQHAATLQCRTNEEGDARVPFATNN